MTSLLAPLAAERAVDAHEFPSRPARARDVAAAVAVAVALLVWAGPLTHGSGGRDAWVLALGLLSLLPALGLLRPWSSLPVLHVLVAMAPASAAFVVCLTAPTGFDGLDETAALAYCGALYLVVRSWAVDDLRRRLLLVVVALAGLEQFTQAYLPWWGSSSVSTLMTGTFYWHNQFAAFMLGTGLAAGVLAVRGSGVLRRAGWLIAPWCFAALLFAGSRASLAIFVLAWAGVAVLSLLDRKGRVACLALIGTSLALATLLTSPLLMEHSGWFSSTVQTREAEQGVEGNGRARLALWRAAVDLGMRHPVTGAGFDTFGAAGSALMPANAGLSAHVHNGYLQAFSDGGLLLLGAVTVATGLPLLAAVRLLYRRRRGDDVLAVAVTASLCALVLHSGVDFDWTYPSLAALFAVLAALVPTSAPHAARSRRVTVPMAVLVLVLVVVAVPAALRASALRAPQADTPVWATPFAAVVPLHGSLDILPAAAVCREELTSPRRSVREHALGCTARAARDDPALDLRRAVAMAENGQIQEAVRRANSVIATHADRRPMLHVWRAEVLRAAGRDDAAQAELGWLLAYLRDQGMTTHAYLVERLMTDDGTVSRS